MSETQEQVRTESSSRRIRTYLGGQLVADTIRPLLVWETPRHPTYHLPLADLHAHLKPTGATDDSASLGTARIHDVEVGGARAAAAAKVYEDPAVAALRDHVRLDWTAMDAWFEEDEQVHFHPRNPYVRVDALRSSRHVVVEMDGYVLAESRTPVVLYETGHVPRWYLPATDVRRDLLVPSDKVTNCPYKGTTRYYDVRVGDRQEQDLAWSYPAPFPESAPIAGYLCFPSERVTITVDDVRQ